VVTDGAVAAGGPDNAEGGGEGTVLASARCAPQTLVRKPMTTTAKPHASDASTKTRSFLTAVVRLELIQLPRATIRLVLVLVPLPRKSPNGYRGDLSENPPESEASFSVVNFKYSEWLTFGGG
jgi:hypothetical protein